MKVTPSFKKDESLDLEIEIGKELLVDSGRVGSDSGANVDQIAVTAKEKTVTSVNINFGETVILSALSEGVEAKSTDRTPGIGDIPLIRNFFSTRERSRQNTSVIILLTPHRDLSFQSDIQYDPKIENIKKFFINHIYADTNLPSVIERLAQSDVTDVYKIYHHDLYNKESLKKAIDYSLEHIDEY